MVHHSRMWPQTSISRKLNIIPLKTAKISVSKKLLCLLLSSFCCYTVSLSYLLMLWLSQFKCFKLYSSIVSQLPLCLRPCTSSYLNSNLHYCNSSLICYPDLWPRMLLFIRHQLRKLSTFLWIITFSEM